MISRSSWVQVQLAALGVSTAHHSEVFLLIIWLREQLKPSISLSLYNWEFMWTPTEVAVSRNTHQEPVKVHPKVYGDKRGNKRTKKFKEADLSSWRRLLTSDSESEFIQLVWQSRRRIDIEYGSSLHSVERTRKDMRH